MFKISTILLIVLAMFVAVSPLKADPLSEEELIRSKTIIKSMRLGVATGLLSYPIYRIGLGKYNISPKEKIKTEYRYVKLPIKIPGDTTTYYERKWVMYQMPQIISPKQQKIGTSILASMTLSFLVSSLDYTLKPKEYDISVNDYVAILLFGSSPSYIIPFSIEGLFSKKTSLGEKIFCGGLLLFEGFLVKKMFEE